MVTFISGAMAARHCRLHFPSCHEDGSSSDSVGFICVVSYFHRPSLRGIETTMSEVTITSGPMLGKNSLPFDSIQWGIVRTSWASFPIMSWARNHTQSFLAAHVECSRSPRRLTAICWVCSCAECSRSGGISGSCKRVDGGEHGVDPGYWYWWSDGQTITPSKRSPYTWTHPWRLVPQFRCRKVWEVRHEAWRHVLYDHAVQGHLLTPSHVLVQRRLWNFTLCMTDLSLISCWLWSMDKHVAWSDEVTSHNTLRITRRELG